MAASRLLRVLLRQSSRASLPSNSPFPLTAVTVKAPELLEQFEKDFGVVVEASASGNSASATAKTASDVSQVPIDSLETAEDIAFFVDVPGLEKRDLKIQVNQQDRSLTISGERFKPVFADASTPAAKHVSKFERQFGKFSRRIVLPESADTQLVSAKVDKGVLRIKVLKQLNQGPDIQEVEID